MRKLRSPFITLASTWSPSFDGGSNDETVSVDCIMRFPALRVSCQEVPRRNGPGLTPSIRWIAGIHCLEEPRSESTENTRSGLAAIIAVRVKVMGWPERNAVIKDRKSTRLNSSHLVISYAVFCLKKKK